MRSPTIFKTIPRDKASIIIMIGLVTGSIIITLIFKSILSGTFPSLKEGLACSEMNFCKKCVKSRNCDSKSCVWGALPGSNPICVSSNDSHYKGPGNSQYYATNDSGCDAQLGVLMTAAERAKTEKDTADAAVTAAQTIVDQAIADRLVKQTAQTAATPATKPAADLAFTAAQTAVTLANNTLQDAKTTQAQKTTLHSTAAQKAARAEQQIGDK